MHSHFTGTWRTRIAAGASAAMLSAFALTAPVQAADPNTPVDAIRTATPIKHVVIIVGENRSFDHLFATYVPRQISSAPNGGKFFTTRGSSSRLISSAPGRALR